MVFVASLMLLVFCDLFELDLWVLIVSGARPCHFVCDVVLLLFFMVFSCLFLVLSFYVLILGNWLGKEES